MKKYIDKTRYYLDWLFRDLNTRRGRWVIAEVPNLPLLVFMGAIILNVVLYPGFIQKFFGFVGYAALIYWGVLEFKGGRSRFRKLLGILGVLASIGAFFLTLSA
jgi:hypothetical protein